MTAHTHCPVCYADVEVEIRIATSRNADGPDVAIEGTEVSDLACPHRADVLLWLSTDEGAAWCAEQVEACRVEGSLA